MTPSHPLRAEQRGNSTLGLLLLGATLAIGLVIAAALVSRSLERIKLAGDRITVKGSAEEKVVSDAGSWRGSVVVRGRDLPSGSRDLEASASRLQALLRKLAGDRASLAVGPIESRPLYVINDEGRQTGQISGYELARTFELKSQDVELIGQVAQQASGLVSEGVAVNAQPPQYFYQDLSSVKVRLIGAATRDAQLRAGQFAANSGVTVGALRSASQGVFQITRPNSTETDDYGSYDTGTVDKVVKAVVTVEYAVERD